MWMLAIETGAASFMSLAEKKMKNKQADKKSKTKLQQQQQQRTLKSMLTTGQLVFW